MDRITRNKKILNIILRAHIEDAEPVGSRYVSDIIGLSSATIRNIMAELEDDGYLMQPHTSAGRIPTERAYRSYVNSLIQARNSHIQEIRRLNEELLLKYKEYNDIIDQASYAISKITNYTSFVVHSQNHIHLDGQWHMLEHPEFHDLDEVRNILKILDEKEKLLNILNSYIAMGTLKIHIGSENSIAGLENCSVITASYRIKDNVVGGIGIIGPVRMQYRKVVPVIRYLADSISRVLNNI